MEMFDSQYMERRRYITSSLVALTALAGCSQSTDTRSEGQSNTTPTAGDVTDIPGWNGETLNTSTLLDSHVQKLTNAGAFTVAITANGTTNGNATLQYKTNVTQQRYHVTATFSERPNRTGYLTNDELAIRITGTETRYRTNQDPSASVASRLPYTAANVNDDFGISLAESLQSYNYQYAGTTTVAGKPVFRFESMATAGSEPRAVVLVDAQGIIRQASFESSEGTVTHEFSAIGDTQITPPEWLPAARQSSGDATVTETTPTEPATPSDGSTVNITARAFRPKRLEVNVGDTVVWKNTSARTHTVTCYGGRHPDGAAYFASGGFDSESAARTAWQSSRDGGIAEGDTYEHTFRTPGEYTYFCIAHERTGMTGTISVTDS